MDWKIQYITVLQLEHLLMDSQHSNVCIFVCVVGNECSFHHPIHFLFTSPRVFHSYPAVTARYQVLADFLW